ncbi:hypothetical protein AXX17_AT1G55210 [Arabidopsis thaliana]|uniref:Uncharacterized protein n=1 Tax=Arabidopsis thaliana TaxID=3702 RepID=A0A178W4K8_ARATH|nr:hypothetical protein AXX17_AT1G55210 [Arabidopsis thaliana]
MQVLLPLPEYRELDITSTQSRISSSMRVYDGIRNCTKIIIYLQYTNHQASQQ